MRPISAPGVPPRQWHVPVPARWHGPTVQPQPRGARAAGLQQSAPLQGETMRRWIRILVLALVAAVAVHTAWRGDRPATDGVDDVPHPAATAGQAAPAGTDEAPSWLPPEAFDTLALIEAGGPFPYDRDGTVFQNREGRLPSQPRGHYRE